MRTRFVRRARDPKDKEAGKTPLAWEARSKSEKKIVTREEAFEALRYARKVYKNLYSINSKLKASEAYLVAADALEEVGEYELSLAAKERAKKLKKLWEKNTPIHPNPKRIKRIYEYHRRNKKQASIAFKYAKWQSQFKKIGHIGDKNWPKYEGGPVFQRLDDRSYELHWIQPVGSNYIVYNVYIVPLDIEPLPSWINARDVANQSNKTPGWVRKGWSSPNPMVRAMTRWDVALYYGWENLDGYPQTMTRKEIRTRYRR